MKRAVGAVALIALLAPAAASTRSTGTLHLRAFFSSPNLDAACRPGAPPDTVCKALRASARVRGLGDARLEGIQAVTDPGFRVHVSGRLVVAGRGALDLEADNSQTSRQIMLALRITGGTGVFAGASGEGTYQLDGRTNQTSLWAVSLTVPGHEFDLRAPRLVGSTASVRRRGASCVIRVAYRVDDDRPGPVRVSLSAGSRRVSASKPSGVLSLTVRRAPRVGLTLLAADASANTARRLLTLRC